MARASDEKKKFALIKLVLGLLGAGAVVGLYFLTNAEKSEVQKREEERLADFVAKTPTEDKQCSETLVAGKTEKSAATYTLCCAKEFHYSESETLGKSFADYTDDLMNTKTYGTCKNEVGASDMRWNVPIETVRNICCFNRHLAEFKYSWEKITDFWTELENVRGTDSLEDENPKNTMIFYDSITQLPLYVAPIGRSWKNFIDESTVHGWPSFRDQEVIQKNVRILPGHKGELVSVHGTHLGHNLPDEKGNRHCVNLVSAAGKKKEC